MSEYIVDVTGLESGDYAIAREEIVRCRDCKYYDDYTGCCTRRDYVAPMASTPEGFCALGERKTINKTGDFVTHDNRTTELREKLNKLVIELDRLDITLDSPSSGMTLGEYEQELEKLLDGFTQAIAATLGKPEIVRCGDCKHGHESDWPVFLEIPSDYLDCTGPLVETWDYYRDEPKDNPVPPDGFCKWGERRESE